MKLKKFIATVAAFSIMAATLAVAPAQAEGEKARVYLKDAGTQTAGSTTFAVVDVYLELPEALEGYVENEPDWETTFESTFSGKVIQTAGIDIPYVDGFQFVAARSTVVDGWTKTANATAQQASISFAGTADFTKSYSGAVGKIASLQYRITGDGDTSKIAIKESSFIVDIYSWDGTEKSTPTSTKYMSSNNNVLFEEGAPDPGTKYVINFDPAQVTVTLGGSAIDANSEVDENETISVAVVDVAGKTETLYVNGVETAETEFVVTEALEFTVTYEDEVIPPSYTYSIADAGYRAGKAADKEDVFYKINFNAIADGAKTLVATVAEKDFSVPLNAPIVEGDAGLDFTFVFLGVPVSVFGTDTIVEKFTAFGTDNQAYEAK